VYCRALHDGLLQTTETKRCMGNIVSFSVPHLTCMIRFADLTTAKNVADYSGMVVHGRGAFPALHHPQMHNVPVAIIHFRSHSPRLLHLFTHSTTHAAASLAIPVSQLVYLPMQHSLWTVPKGPLAHKKSQENFEQKVHKCAIKTWDANEQVVGLWLKYLK
jgi:small subunit ribosomal protein S10